MFYKPNAEKTEIKSVHKSYLLYRDACAVSLVLGLAFCGLTLMWLELTGGLPIQYSLVFGVFSVGLGIAAENTGERMVTSAVAASVSES